MRPLTRRHILQGGLAATAALGLSRVARSSGPVQGQPKILEIFLKGGFDPSRSFWVDPDLSDGQDEPQWDQFAGSLPPTSTVNGLYADTLGPSAAPLFGSSLLSGCRVLAMSHTFEPHEVAVPHAVTGSFLGRPALAGLGAAVNAMLDDGSPLHAFVIDGGNVETATYASAIGQFDPIYRPPVLKVGDPTLLTTLARSGLTEYDAIEEHLAELYAARMTHWNNSAPSRSRGHDAYDAAAHLLHEWSAELATLLAGTSIADAVTPKSWTLNGTRVGVRVGAELLQSTTEDVRYVCVIDNGVFKTYDSHDAFGTDATIASTHQAGNLYNLCSILADLSAEISPSGGGMLDGVLVVLNTEFGRRELSGDGRGTEHWPFGYATVLLGGPLTDVHRRGAIDSDGFAKAGPLGRGPYSPTELRAVLAQHLGADFETLLGADTPDTPDTATLYDEIF